MPSTERSLEEKENLAGSEALPEHTLVDPELLGSKMSLGIENSWNCYDC